MPVPKRKTSNSRRDQRSASKFLRPQAFSTCPNCSEPIMPHILCSSCGHYKGKKVTTTKMERTLKRSHARKAAVEKQQQMRAEMQQEQPAHEAKSE